MSELCIAGCSFDAAANVVEHPSGRMRDAPNDTVWELAQQLLDSLLVADEEWDRIAQEAYG